MEKEYINRIGQRVVNCEIGYKVYDVDNKDEVILRVGDTYKRKDGTEIYVFKDRDAFNAGKESKEACFMSQGVLVAYEAALKKVQSDPELSDDDKMNTIRKINVEIGLKYIDIASTVGEEMAESVFNDIEEKYGI